MRGGHGITKAIILIRDGVKLAEKKTYALRHRFRTLLWF